MKPAVRWKTDRRGKRTFTIDMLAVRAHVAANSLPDEDRKLIDRVLPGVLKPLARDIALAAVLSEPRECPHCGPISCPLSQHTCPYVAQT